VTAALPLVNQQRRLHVDAMKTTNGHSRSMDFHTLTDKRSLVRPVALIPLIGPSSSSSSTATLTSLRTSTSLEFDDNGKPSGVLVDDDFLPMSSPVDDDFWHTTGKHSAFHQSTDCFPNVGSSPDLEVKRFDLQHINALSETSCDEDEDEHGKSNIAHPRQRHYQVKELQKPLVPLKSIVSPSGEPRQATCRSASLIDSLDATFCFSLMFSSCLQFG
jgi:hypothetical protein